MKYKSLPSTCTIMDEVHLFNEMWLVKAEGTMIICRQSPITGMEHFAELAITNEQVDQFSKGTKVQHAFPNLSKEEREFLLTGIVPEEWSTAFPEED